MRKQIAGTVMNLLLTRRAEKESCGSSMSISGEFWPAWEGGEKYPDLTGIWFFMAYRRIAVQGCQDQKKVPRTTRRTAV